jgi:hypothetical protein
MRSCRDASKEDQWPRTVLCSVQPPLTWPPWIDHAFRTVAWDAQRRTPSSTGGIQLESVNARPLHHTITYPTFWQCPHMHCRPRPHSLWHQGHSPHHLLPHLTLPPAASCHLAAPLAPTSAAPKIYVVMSLQLLRPPPSCCSWLPKNYLMFLIIPNTNIPSWRFSVSSFLIIPSNCVLHWWYQCLVGQNRWCHMYTSLLEDER